MILPVLANLTQVHNVIYPPSLVSTSHVIHNGRTITNIIWSCFATISVCIWIGVHPNMPKPQVGEMPGKVRLYNLLKRIGVSVLALVAPEFILVWAIRQWFAARSWAKEFQHAAFPKKPPSEASPTVIPVWKRVWLALAGWPRRCQRWWDGATEPDEKSSKMWTKTHAFFVIMGGFHLFDDHGKPLHPLGPKDVLKLIKKDMPSEEENPVPSVLDGEENPGPSFPINYFALRPPKKEYTEFHTDEELKEENDKEQNLIPPSKYEIKDKSKGDAFSKTIVIGQTLWFVAQCLARWIQDITVTELEIVTLAYTLIIVLIYFAWWDKPLGVDQPVRIQPGIMNINTVTTRHLADSQMKESVEPHMTYSPPDHGPSHVLSVPGKTRFQIWHDIFTGTYDMEVELHDEKKVPVFYAGQPDSHDLALADLIASIFAILFGAIHCAAWSFVFPSHVEQLLWRISSIAVVGGPGIWVLFFSLTVGMGWEGQRAREKERMERMAETAETAAKRARTRAEKMAVVVAAKIKNKDYSLTDIDEPEAMEAKVATAATKAAMAEAEGMTIRAMAETAARAAAEWSKKRERVLKIPRYLSIAIIPVYIVARIVLLTLAFTTLRLLPQAAYYSVTWTTFMPHV